jgi:flagellar hook protein FlgE
VGVFTNGIRKDIAAIRVATFQNPSGLESIGNNFLTASANSGEPVPTKGLSGGAGAIHGGTLEGSNVEVAAEFVNLIQAQNGYMANARTIRVTNDMLRELTGLIR